MGKREEEGAREERAAGAQERAMRVVPVENEPDGEAEGGDVVSSGGASEGEAHVRARGENLAGELIRAIIGVVLVCARRLFQL